MDVKDIPLADLLVMAKYGDHQVLWRTAFLLHARLPEPTPEPVDRVQRVIDRVQQVIDRVQSELGPCYCTVECTRYASGLNEYRIYVDALPEGVRVHPFDLSDIDGLVAALREKLSVPT